MGSEPLRIEFLTVQCMSHLYDFIPDLDVPILAFGFCYTIVFIICIATVKQIFSPILTVGNSASEVPKSVAEPVPTHPTQTIQRSPARLTPDLQEIQVEPPAQPTPPPQPAGLVPELPELQTPPPPNSLAAELDLARPVAPSPPPPPATPPPEPFEDIVEIIHQQQNEEAEEPIQEPPPAFADYKVVLEAETKENNGELLTEQKQQLTDAPDNEQLEEIPISKSKPNVEIENGHQEMRNMENQEEVTLHRSNSLKNVQFEVIHEPPPQPTQLSTKPQELEERTTAKLPAELLSKPLVASTTGSGEGGSLTEEEAAIYRAKMAEQRRLAKERLAEQQRVFNVYCEASAEKAETYKWKSSEYRRHGLNQECDNMTQTLPQFPYRLEEEAEKERKAKREAERQAAIEAARERAIEEARLAAEARMAREAAEEQARLEAERKAQERADKDRQASLDWSKAMVDLTESDLDKSLKCISAQDGTVT
ncbi:hypothetical protein ACTXT7_013035 [Hymenolepis weldensis]